MSNLSALVIEAFSVGFTVEHTYNTLLNTRTRIRFDDLDAMFAFRDACNVPSEVFPTIVYRDCYMVQFLRTYISEDLAKKFKEFAYSTSRNPVLADGPVPELTEQEKGMVRAAGRYILTKAYEANDSGFSDRETRNDTNKSEDIIRLETQWRARPDYRRSNRKYKEFYDLMDWRWHRLTPQAMKEYMWTRIPPFIGQRQGPF